MAAKVVTVFGATGAQGGSVVEALSHDPSCHVRAVTRNPRAQSSGHLHNLKGVEVSYFAVSLYLFLLTSSICNLTAEIWFSLFGVLYQGKLQYYSL